MINMLMMLLFYRRATRREKTAWQIHPYYGDEEWALGCFEKSQPYTRAASSRTVSSTTKRKPKQCWDGREVRMKMQMRTDKRGNSYQQRDKKNKHSYVKPTAVQGTSFLHTEKDRDKPV